MNKLLLTLVATAGLAACSQPVGENAGTMSSATPSPVRSEAGVPPYVLRLGARTDAVAPLARFEGSFDIENDCLVFRMGEATFLAGLSTAGEVSVAGGTVTIGERRLRLGERTVVSGAQLPAEELRKADPAPPADCAWPALRVI